MPTLLDEGDGLFKTHVRLEDVNDVIKDQLGTNHVLGPNTKYTVIGDGNGFMSKVILVEPDWEDSNLPSKFVLKIASATHVHAMSDKMKDNGFELTPEMREHIFSKLAVMSKTMHNHEVDLYHIFEKWNIPEVTLNPKIYFSTKFDDDNQVKGLIGMEYAENAITRHLYVNVEPESLYPVLKVIATFQARSLDFSEDEIASITGFDFKDMMQAVHNDEGIRGMFEGVRKINKTLLSEKVDKLLEHGAELFDLDLPKKLNNIVGIEKDVMVHGDLWCANIIWRKDANEYSVNKVIDYQLVHMGNPAEDLVRLFLSSLSGRDFTSQWESLLEKFYEYFLEALDHQVPPYTLAQLKESFERYYMLGAFLMLPMFGPIVDIKLGLEKNVEERDKIQEILTERSQVLLDNMIKYYNMYKN